MEKILAAGLILLTFSASFLCFCFAAERAAGPSVIRKPAAEPFLHKGTELSFPARIHSFEKTAARINPLPEYGTDIVYENETGSLADVYLYQPGEDFRAHEAATKERIRNAAANSRHIEKVEETAFTGTLPPEESGCACSQYRLKLKTESLLTRLYLFPYRNYFVKIRITWPEDFPEEESAADLFASRILRLAFPEADRRTQNTHTGE